MADGFLGTASFGHQTKDVRTKVQPTITKTNTIESKTDMSSCNDDMKNVKVVTSKKESKVEAFVPLVNPMDIPKLVNRAVDNFKGVVDKPLNTPNEKSIVILQQKREEPKEEPKDTSITDEEADEIIDDLMTHGTFLVSEGKKVERKPTLTDGIDCQGWEANIKRAILDKAKGTTPEMAARMAKNIVDQYARFRNEGMNHEKAANATQNALAQAFERQHKVKESERALYTNAYGEGLQPVAGPAIVPIYLAGVAFATLLCQTFYTTQDISNRNQKNANANAHQLYRMDIARQGSGSGWTDSGVDTEAGKVQINSTPIADPTPTREGFDAAPQEYARGVNEGFGIADNIPDMSILTVLGYGAKNQARNNSHGTTSLNQLDIDYSTPEAPFSLRIDPVTGKGPMHVDSRDFTSATSYTSEGAARNSKQFWAQWAEKHPETLSADNLQAMNSKSHFLAPKVDAQWIKHFPEHSSYLDQTLIHHHIDHGDLVTALPKSLHGSNPGRSYFHTNLGGKK